MQIVRFLPNNEYKAAVNSASPSATNPFATMNDISGFITVETDPVFSASAAANVINTGAGTLFLADDGTYKPVGGGVTLVDYTSLDTTVITTGSITGVVHSNLVVNGLDNTKTYIAEVFFMFDKIGGGNAFFEFRNFAANINSQQSLWREGGVWSSAVLKGEVTPTAGSVQLDLLFGVTNNLVSVTEVRFALREKQV